MRLDTETRLSGTLRGVRASAARLVFILACTLLAWSSAAFGSVIYEFNLPATGMPSLDPPYPTVATLTLTETADGVQFVLDPDENSPGFLANSATSFLEQIDFVYAGPALTDASFRNDDGAIDSFDFLSNPNNMDSGYAANAFHIVVDFPSRNDPYRFTPDETRTWTILGADLAQFTDSSATANNKPSSIVGVLSVTGYSLPGHRPTPSNWVSEALPEPGTLTLLVTGFGLLAVARRKRRV